MARKTEELRPVMTRLPEELRRRLERVAWASQRSMNAEIIHRLELSFKEESESKLEARLAARLEEAVKRIEEATGGKVARLPKKARKTQEGKS